jgi:hypothetical protein
LDDTSNTPSPPFQPFPSDEVIREHYHPRHWPKRAWKVGDRVRIAQYAGVYSGLHGTITQMPHQPLNGTSYYEFGVQLDDKVSEYGPETPAHGYNSEELELIPRRSSSVGRARPS